MHVFKSRGFNISLLTCCFAGGAFGASLALAASQPPTWASARHEHWEIGSVLLCFQHEAQLDDSPASLSAKHSQLSQLLTFLSALPSL